ncbi:hypothetical protein [Agrobacterium sp. LAD9]|uniref:hypothetical protein n=1 Tax=Agrobacterium sp. LAD9 TaxID=2055153 RepID=UPI000D1F4DDB|nr:hypothetical protein [Agrobacterium sp. LAD9]
MSYRLTMPLVDIDQPFTAVGDLEDALASLHARAIWFLSTRSNAEVNEEYDDLGAYIWTVQKDDEYAAHFALAERRHALSHYPEDALWIPFDGAWKLRDVEAAVKSDNWIAGFMVVGVDQYLAKFTTGSIH